MSRAATLLDRLGRPGDVRLGTGHADAVARLPTGLPVLDEALDGGLPRGRVTELTGPRSAGRTGLACAIAAAATRAGETIAWVDPEDALEPETAAARRDRAGRARSGCGRASAADALRAAEILLRRRRLRARRARPRIDGTRPPARGAARAARRAHRHDAARRHAAAARGPVRRARPRADRPASALERRRGTAPPARRHRRARHRGALAGRTAGADARREGGLCR